MFITKNVLAKKKYIGFMRDEHFYIEYNNILSAFYIL